MSRLFRGAGGGLSRWETALSSIAFAAWVRVPQLLSTDRCILQVKSAANSNSILDGFTLGLNSLRQFYFSKSSSSATRTATEGVSFTSGALDQWAHVGGTSVGSFTTVYVNGIQAGSDFAVLAPTVTPDTVSVGARYTTAAGLTNSFVGEIFEPVIWAGSSFTGFTGLEFIALARGRDPRAVQPTNIVYLADRKITADADLNYRNPAANDANGLGTLTRYQGDGFPVSSIPPQVLATRTRRPARIYAFPSGPIKRLGYFQPITFNPVGNF